MLVYGKHVAEEILKKEKKIEKIFLQDNFSDKNIISLIKKRKIEVKYCSKQEIGRLVDGAHQGIILSIPEYHYYSLEEVLNKRPNFIVILDHIEDSHNLGAIIRTCEAAGVDAIILPKDRQILINATVMKTSVGTAENIPIVCVTNLVQTIETLKKEGFWIVGTALENSVDYREIDYSSKIGLVIGNEGKGISPLIFKSCDFVANIPMYGTTNSLNASVAAGIMIYEVIRNRK